MGCKYKVAGNGCVAWIALEAAVSPLRQAVCLLSPWCSTASPCSKIHLFAFCQKVKNTLWIQHGFFLRGRRNVLPEEEQNPLSWEYCCTGSWPAFQLCCWGWWQKLCLWHPANWVSSLSWHNSLMPLFASPEFEFPGFGGAKVISSPGCWVGLELYLFQ